MNLLAQATAEERVFVVFEVFLVVLIGAGILFALYVLIYLGLSPLLLAGGGEGSKRAHRVMSGYLIVAPLVLSNLVAVFGLFAIQLAAIHWLYGAWAGPQRILERAFAAAGGSAPDGVQAEIVSRLRACAPLQSAGYGGPMEVLTSIVWLLTHAINWVILLSLLVAMLRDLGVTSWSFLAAPVQREIHGRPWGELIRTALMRFLHLLFYTIFAGALFVAGAVGVMALGWLTLRMIASLLVDYLNEIAAATSGFLPFALLGSFYVCMMEVLVLFLLITGLLAFVVSRSISLQIEQALSRHLGLPLAEVPPPKLWAPVRASALLLGKIFVAVLPVWLLMKVAVYLPLLLSAPIGVFAHLFSFNVVLFLLKAHRDLKPLLVEAWAGRPWLRPPEAKAPAPAPANP